MDGEDYCPSADQVKAALREKFGEATSARDFRTFRASSIVAGALQEAGEDQLGRKAMLKHSIAESAKSLANTPTVGRGAMLIPRLRRRSQTRILTRHRCSRAPKGRIDPWRNRAVAPAQAQG
jgi:DNA topoisomerase IB